MRRCLWPAACQRRGVRSCTPPRCDRNWCRNNTIMLKRQRPASPIPLQWDAVEAEKGLPDDLFEPMSKRRRYFAPPGIDSHADEHSSTGYPDDSTQAEGSSNAARREARSGIHEWQKDAGEYRHANSLLHDLHAEQRHRLIFSSSSTLSSTLQRRDGASQVPNPLHSPHPSIPPIEDRLTGDPYHTPHSHTHKGEDTSVSTGEAEVVSQRYAETNRLLRSLFFSRRQHEAEDARQR